MFLNNCLMKKFLFFVFAVVSLFYQIQVHAQIVSVISEDTLLVQTYDTVVLFRHPDFINCNMTAWNYTIQDPQFAHGTMEEYYYKFVNHLYSPVEGYDSVHNLPVTYYPFSLAGDFFGKNNYLVEAYGQPFTLDEQVHIIGIAAQVRGDIYGLSKRLYITSEKHGFNPLASTYVYPASLVEGNDANSMGYYLFNDTVLVLDQFIIVGESFYNPSDTSKKYGSILPAPYLKYNATFSISDSLWRDTTIGCQGSDTPWLKKNGQWCRFSEDTIYSLVRNSTLNFNPIILMPSSSSISSVDLEKTCSIYPNPVKDYVFLQSNFKILQVHIYDMTGKKLKEQNYYSYEAKVDLQTIPSGTYIIKIKTVKGEFEKKIVK